MKVQLNYLGVADVILIRSCLAHYEADLMTADRPHEDRAVTQAVVQTLDTLRRLDRRLRRWVEKVDAAIDDTGGDEGSDDDIPF